VADGRLDRDPIVERAVESLRPLPAVDAESVARVVAAAARARALDVAPNEDDLLPSGFGRPPRGRRLATLTAIAAGIVLLGISISVWRVQRTSGELAARAGAPESAPQTSFAAANAANEKSSIDALPIPTQFVFDGRARHVSLVGDFNNWDERATPLEREPGSTIWSATVPIQRGRHIYAFMVDSVWTIDKRAPVARDPDFGVTGSVILVGRP
jgi:AMP-activated protein kinase-like protein